MCVVGGMGCVGVCVRVCGCVCEGALEFLPGSSCWPIPGKVKLLLISGKKSPSLLYHISRFLSHQFVTWYLRSISKTKIVKLFCPCMSEHMIYIKNVTNVTQTLHQNVANVTKQNIASKEILMIEFHMKYMKLFVYVDRHLCIAQYKIPLHIREYLLWSHLEQDHSFVQSHKRDQSLHGLQSWPWRRI